MFSLGLKGRTGSLLLGGFQLFDSFAQILAGDVTVILIMFSANGLLVFSQYLC